jgi:hypothetical protein
VDYLKEATPFPKVPPSNEDPSSEFMLTPVLNLIWTFDFVSLNYIVGISSSST